MVYRNNFMYLFLLRATIQILLKIYTLDSTIRRRKASYVPATDKTDSAFGLNSTESFREICATTFSISSSF